MNLKLFFQIALICFFTGTLHAATTPKTLRVGISMGIQHLGAKKAKQLKEAGIDCIETNLTAFIRKDSLQFNLSDEEIITRLTLAKKAADEANLEIWSIHMPYGKRTDISLLNNEDRKKAIEFHKKVLQFVSILQPKIILFHPSSHLGLNERSERISQLLKSAKTLVKEVKAINATMVIENMLGPELLLKAGGKLERPLLRTVEEAAAVFKKLPKDVYSAVDLNHIAKPEALLLALGNRVKSIHVADGEGKAERHYFPCDNKGENNWKAILKALDDIGYNGPFMYESSTKDITQYKKCYDSLTAL